MAREPRHVLPLINQVSLSYNHKPSFVQIELSLCSPMQVFRSEPSWAMSLESTVCDNVCYLMGHVPKNEIVKISSME